jgi:hypothetical protein
MKKETAMTETEIPKTFSEMEMTGCRAVSVEVAAQATGQKNQIADSPAAINAAKGTNPLIRLGPSGPPTLRAGAPARDNCVFFVKSNQGLRG